MINTFMFYYGGCKMCNISMGVINMLSSLIVAIVVIVALFISNRTNKLQNKSIQANTFDSITKRINELMDSMPTEEKETSDWHLKLLNALEYYTFFVNNGYLNKEMASHYKNYIVDYCNSLQEECPEVIKQLNEERLPKQYYELKKYYKNITNKEAPI